MSFYSSIREKLLSGFYGFWVRNYRIGLMLVLMVSFLGISGLIAIPKESTPDIKFGIVMINTAYTGVTPEEIDALITTRIEKKIQNIDGIDAIESSSSLGFSTIVATLETEADIDAVTQEISDAVDKADIPDDATEPVVRSINTQSQLLFSVFLANTDPYISEDALFTAAYEVQRHFEGNFNIESVTISSSSGAETTMESTDSGGDSSEIEIIVHGEKLEAMGLKLQTIADIIRSYNQSFPLGSFAINTKKYDLRVEGNIESFEELLNIPISLSEGGSVPLGHFATLHRKWNGSAINHMNIGVQTGLPFIQLNFNKEPGKSVFETAKITRAELDAYVSKLGPTWKIVYGLDLAEIITEDYRNLANNAWQTILLVAICIVFFVGLKESLIASITIPLAFLVSIMTLNRMDMSLNFMTNFSLVLSFGIAIDLTLVIIEETAKKVKLGYDPGTAVLLAVNELKLSVISSTAVTLVVFIPMMMLPGIIGKFLSYIPLTVFSSLLATLFLALTTNSSLFVKLARPRLTYVRQPAIEEHLSEEERILLTEERSNKLERPASSETLREKIIEWAENWYEQSLTRWLATSFRRRILIWVPILLTIISFFVLTPRLIGGGLFPTEDSPFIFININAPPGTKQTELLRMVTVDNVPLEERFAPFPEIKLVTFHIADEKVTLYVELTTVNERKQKHERTSQELEVAFSKALSPLLSQGVTVGIKADQNGPPTGKPVGIKLLARSTDDLPLLKNVAKDFESFVQSIEGTRNVTNSSPDSPGEIVLHVNRNRAALVGISPLMIYQTISTESRGVKAGSITIDDRDIDMVVKSDTHYDSLVLDKIQSLEISTPAGPMNIGSLLNYEIGNAITVVQRIDGDLTIAIEADVRPGYVGGKLLEQLNAYAKNYPFPTGVSYKKSGEFEENRELINGAITALLFSILLIFVILVFVFNSYSQPLIILYTIFLGLLGVNIGLWIVKLFNPAIGYNMPMAIGFIALNGLVVTNAIILIDKINRNRSAGMKPLMTVLDGGKTRMVAQIVTALTTIFGLLPTAFQDAFWGSLSWTVICGTIVATILTLYCIPALYYETYLHDKKSFTKRRKNIAKSLLMVGGRLGRKLLRSASSSSPEQD